MESNFIKYFSFKKLYHLYIILLFVICFVLLGFNYIYAQGIISTDVEQIDFATGLFQREMYKMAQSEYEKFIKMFPNSELKHEANFGKAECLFFLKDYKEAIVAYKDYISNYPKEDKIAISKLRIGQALYFTKDYKVALSSFESVEGKNLSKNFLQLLRFFIGKTYIALGDNIKALESYEKAAKVIKGSKYSVFSYIEIADYYSKESNVKKAIKYYDQAYNSTSDKNTKSLILYKKGKLQFSSGNYSGSVDTFKEILKKYPDQDVVQDSLANLLLALFNLSKYQEVVSEYVENEQFIPQEERFFEVHFIIASSYFAQEKFDDAINLLDKLLSISSLSEENKNLAFLKKAEIYIKNVQLQKAIILLDSKLKKNKEDKDRILLLKAEAYYGLGKFKESYKFYKDLLKNYPDSEYADDALYGAAHSMKSAGNNKEAMELFYEYFQKGKDLGKQRQALYNEILVSYSENLIDRAIEHSEMYLDKFGDWFRAEGVMLRLGSLYSKKNEYEKAVNIFNRFIKKYEKSERLQEVYFLLGYNLQQLKKNDEALKYYMKIDADKDNKKLYYSALKNIAMIYLEKEEDDKATGILDKIISEFEENDLDLESYFWLSEKYISSKKYDSGLRILKKAEQTEKGKECKLEIAYFKANAYKEKGDFSKAIKNYNVVISSKEDDVYVGPSHIGKGLCYKEMGKNKEAKKEFEEAIMKDPDDNTVTIRARFEIANLAEDSGDLEEAYKYYMIVAVLYNDDIYCPQSLFRAGSIFEQLKKKEEAIKAYQEIVDNYKKSNLYEKAKERLKFLSAG